MHVTNVAAAILLRNVKLGVSLLEFLMDEIMDEREVKKMAVIDSSIWLHENEVQHKYCDIFKGMYCDSVVI